MGVLHAHTVVVFDSGWVQDLLGCLVQDVGGRVYVTASREAVRALL
jgi:hypothetical protein